LSFPELQHIPGLVRQTVRRQSGGGNRSSDESRRECDRTMPGVASAAFFASGGAPAMCRKCLSILCQNGSAVPVRDRWKIDKILIFWFQALVQKGFLLISQ
jgi:hypothetical protein